MKFSLKTLLLFLFAALFACGAVLYLSGADPLMDKTSVIERYIIPVWILLASALLFVCAALSLFPNQQRRCRILLFAPLCMLLLYYALALVYCFTTAAVWYAALAALAAVLLCGFLLYTNKKRLDA